MDMGVKLEGTAPGMEDAEETGQISADKLIIWDQFLHPFRGSLKQGRVGCLLVGTDEAAQTFGDGKGKQEMVTWELAF
jgi:hypothetical protein